MASNRRSQTVVDSSQWTQCRSRFVHCGGYFCGCRVHDCPFRSLGHSYGQSPFRIDAAQPRETSQNCFALLPDTAGISRGRQRPEETWNFRQWFCLGYNIPVSKRTSLCMLTIQFTTTQKLQILHTNARP